MSNNTLSLSANTATANSISNSILLRTRAVPLAHSVEQREADASHASQSSSNRELRETKSSSANLQQFASNKACASRERSEPKASAETSLSDLFALALRQE